MPAETLAETRRQFLKESAILGGAAIVGGIGWKDFIATTSKANQLWDEAEKEVEAQGEVKRPDPETLRKAEDLGRQPEWKRQRYYSQEERDHSDNVIIQEYNYNQQVREQYRTKEDRPSVVRRAAGGVAALGGTVTFMAKIKAWHFALSHWWSKVPELKGNK